MTKPTQAEFKQIIRELTQPLNGQYPRPWMTKLSNPLDAAVFIVGKNQRNGYESTSRYTHERHLDGLFNRNSESCRAVYDDFTGGRASPTRKNTDRLVAMLEANGVNRILETNVVCYSTPMSADLRLATHVGGSARGEEIFRYLLTAVQPKVLIVHGAGAAKQLSKVLQAKLGDEPENANDVQINQAAGYQVAVTRSLAPPAYNSWSSWAPEYLERLATHVARHVAS